jgi:hypothetical protein
MSGKTVNLLTLELDRIHRAKANNEKGTCVMGGILEKIIEKKDHPAREALIWNNLFVGPSRRKGVKMQSSWESGNSPFFLHPEIIDEVLKYVYIPRDIAEGVRQFAKQKAVEEANQNGMQRRLRRPQPNRRERQAQGEPSCSYTGSNATLCTAGLGRVSPVRARCDPAIKSRCARPALGLPLHRSHLEHGCGRLPPSSPQRLCDNPRTKRTK